MMTKFLFNLPANCADLICNDKFYDAAKKLIKGASGTDNDYYENLIENAINEYEFETGSKVKKIKCKCNDGICSKPAGIINDGCILIIKITEDINDVDKYDTVCMASMIACNVESCKLFLINKSFNKSNTHLFYMDDRKDQFIKSKFDEFRQYVHKIDEIDVDDLLAEYDILNEQIDEANSRKKEIINELSIKCDFQNTVFSNGRKLQKVISKGRIDYQKLLIDNNVNVNIDKWRKPTTESWRIY